MNTNVNSELSEFIRLNPRFKDGIEKIAALAQSPRYQAAFIFGSVAEGTSGAKSDLDVQVVVDEANLCENINHPIIDDYKLDITFRSFEQIKQLTDIQIEQAKREPNLIRSFIVFDKTGQLTDLRKCISHTKPQRYGPKDYQHAQFMLYHANNKVERFLDDDPISALYSIHANIGEVLKIHFTLNGRWWVSSKNVLKDLEVWDNELALLVKQCVSTAEAVEKFSYWSAIIDHIARPMGGRQPIAENNCSCLACKQDLVTLLY